MEGRCVMPTIVPANIARCMTDADRRALGVQTPDEVVKRITERTEAAIQREFTQWLTGHGYCERAPAYLGRVNPERGWWVHLNETKRNPCLLDVLLLDVRRGRYMEIELKTQSGAIRDGQRAILDVGGPCVLCRTAQAAIDAVLCWEDM